MSKKKRQPKTWGSPTWMVNGCLGKHGKESFRAWQDRGFLNPTGPSPVRKIDPETGEVTIHNVLEDLASAMLKADRSRGGKPKRKKVRKAKRLVSSRPTRETKEEFYKSWEWRTLRMEVLKEQGRHCQCCGSTRNDKIPTGGRVRIVVDHILPVSRFWHLRLDKSNLQVLCEECNQGKGNWDTTDFRAPAPREGAAA